jgi:hypothetical protein
MGNVLRFIRWFLLVPYFSSWKVPMGRPLFTDDVELAKRYRAQNILVLIIVFVLLGVLDATGKDGWLRGLSYFWTVIVSGLCIVVLSVAVNFVLSGDRERELNAEYQAMPRWKRRTFGSTTWAFVAATVLMMAWLRPALPETKSPLTNLHCDAAATEVTADSCASK